MCTCMLHARMPHPARDYTHKRCTNMREHREILVPVTFPVQHLEEVVITAGRPGITAGAVSNRISSSEIHRAGSSLCHIAGTDQWCQFSQHRNNSIQTRHSWNAWQPHPDHQ